MKLILSVLALASLASSIYGLEKIITEWETSTGSGTYGVTGVYGIYYGSTYVFIQTNSLPNDYSIGPKWSKLIFIKENHHYKVDKFIFI
jgi:hypothetical protein